MAPPDTTTEYDFDAACERDAARIEAAHTHHDEQRGADVPDAEMDWIPMRLLTGETIRVPNPAAAAKRRVA